MTETTSNVPPTTDTQPPIITFKKRRAKAIWKRPTTPPPTNNSNDPYNGSSSSEEELGRRVKRGKMTSVVTASSKTNISSERDTLTARSADGDTTVSVSDDATKQSFLSENLPSSGQAAAKGSEIPRGISKDLVNRASHIEKNPIAPTPKFGPVKAPTNVRIITILDYQPDTCKDYKQTGYCGFGDSCKFLHCREDYKQGWELDKEWEKVSKGKDTRGTIVASAGKNEIGEDANEQDASQETIPFACFICKGPYKNPVVTRCGHYFCEACALKRYKKDPSCAACGAGTSGVFNFARRLKK